MNELLKQQTIIVAIISASTTIIVLFITLLTKNYLEKNNLNTKLDLEHKFSQQKLVKEVLARNKVHLNNACESLKRRIGNLQRKHDKGWLEVNNETYDEYYHLSFIYRFLSLFSWIKIIENSLIYLDTTISSKEDMDFIKFLKLFPRVMSSDYLPIEDDSGEETNDHFYRDDMNDFSNYLIENDTVISYFDFKINMKENKEKYKKLIDYFSNLSPFEDRFRWDRIYYLQLTIIIFLNEFGYDFQFTNENKLSTYFKCPKNSKLYNTAFLELCNDFLLNKNNGIRKLTEYINNV